MNKKPLWIEIGLRNGVAFSVTQQDTQPEADSPSYSKWVRAELIDEERAELRQLESLIDGHMNAMRPLLDRWHKMRDQKTFAQESEKLAKIHATNPELGTLEAGCVVEPMKGNLF